jgi:hypothetical protein
VYKLAAVGQMIHKYDEIIFFIYHFISVSYILLLQVRFKFLNGSKEYRGWKFMWPRGQRHIPIYVYRSRS